MTKKESMIENFKSYKQYIEFKSMIDTTTNPKEINSLQTKMNKIDKQIGCNDSGENLIMLYEKRFKNSIVNLQIKKFKCPENFLDRWVRISKGLPEFEKGECVKKKSKIVKDHKNMISLDRIKQLAEIIEIDEKVAIKSFNKLTVKIKFDLKIKQMVNYDPNLVIAYHNFFKCFDVNAKGLIKKAALTGEKITYQNCLKGKAEETKLIDPKIALSIWQSRNNFYRHYPVK